MSKLKASVVSHAGVWAGQVAGQGAITCDPSVLGPGAWLPGVHPGVNTHTIHIPSSTIIYISVMAPCSGWEMLMLTVHCAGRKNSFVSMYNSL